MDIVLIACLLEARWDPDPDGDLGLDLDLDLGQEEADLPGEVVCARHLMLQTLIQLVSSFAIVIYSSSLMGIQQLDVHQPIIRLQSAPVTPILGAISIPPFMAKKDDLNSKNNTSRTKCQEWISMVRDQGWEQEQVPKASKVMEIMDDPRWIAKGDLLSDHIPRKNTQTQDEDLHQDRIPHMEATMIIIKSTQTGDNPKSRQETDSDHQHAV